MKVWYENSRKTIIIMSSYVLELPIKSCRFCCRTGTEHLAPIYEPEHDKTDRITGAPSEDSDQLEYPPSLFSLCCLLEKVLVFSYPKSAQRRLWTDWAYAQADLSLHWALLYFFFLCSSSYEPPHDKSTKWPVRPAKTQTSLGIRPVWSESSLSAWRKLRSLATYWAHSDGHPPNLIRVFAVRMKKAWPLSYLLSAQRRLWSDWADAQADQSLIRLGGCPGWSESTLGTEFILLVFSWGGSNDKIWWVSLFINSTSNISVFYNWSECHTCR